MSSSSALLYAAIAAAVAVGVGALGAWVSSDRAEKRAEADVAFLSACELQAAACAARLEAEGEACFKAAYSPKARYAKSSLDSARFSTCVERGYAAWHRDHVARARQDESERAEALR